MFKTHYMKFLRISVNIKKTIKDKCVVDDSFVILKLIIYQINNENSKKIETFETG